MDTHTIFSKKDVYDGFRTLLTKVVFYLSALNYLLFTSFPTNSYAAPTNRAVLDEPSLLETRKSELPQHAFLFDVLKDHWRMTDPEELSSGNEGEVYKIKDGASAIPDAYCVVKVLTKGKSLKDLDTGDIVQLQIPKHKHIVSTHFILVSDIRDQQYSYLLPEEKPTTIAVYERKHYVIKAIVMEFVEGKELLTLSNATLSARYFQNENERTTFASALALQLWLAVQHLHKHQITHRDIKPENIIVNITTKKLTLVDFGFCARALKGMRQPFGTVGYTAPEVTAPTPYSCSVDLWSMGSVLFTFCFQQEIVQVSNLSATGLQAQQQRILTQQFSALTEDQKNDEYTKICQRDQLSIPPSPSAYNIRTYLFLPQKTLNAASDPENT